MRKILGVLVAALALVGGGLASRAVDASRAKTVETETGRAASSAGQRAADGLSAIVTDLKLKAENAAANPRLVFALQGNVDERTMRDLWRTEDWWRPWRTEFKIYAVAVSGLRLDAVEGIDAAELDSQALLRRVRDHGEGAAEIVVGKGWPYAAAATLVKVPGRDKSPLLLLAKPVDQPMLRRLADKTGGAVTLTNGRTSLIDAGPDAERTRLTQAIGSESAGPIFHAADGGWSAASSVVAPGLWLWTFASAEAARHDADGVARERKLMSWVSMLALAAVALLWGFRRRTAARTTVSDAITTAPMTTAPLAVTAPFSEAADGVGATLDIPGLRLPVPGSAGASPATMDTGSGTRRGTRGDSQGGNPAAATAIAPVPGASGEGNAPGKKEASFGRYTLLDRLGEGGMAEVYTAVTFGAEGFRRKFVIKRLRPELAREAPVVDQFIDEANLASSMVHSNIVPVFDFGKVGEEYFMAQEYILGRDLARVTRRSMERDGRPLPADVVLYVAHETLKALEYAHTKTNEQSQALGIVHRDVSPTNVIVSARGEVKLFDFGIVKAEGRVTKTESGVVKGNVTFMSPEQARGMNVDARADLFSLGLVLYYCLTGQVLYVGNTTYELLLKAATGPGPGEFERLQRLPEPCGTLLQQALQVDPQRRFPTARAFADAVVAHVGGGAAALAALMNHLFNEDFRAEETRFRTADPPADRVRR